MEGANLAEIAVELRLAETMSALAFAVELGAMCEAGRMQALEQLAARIGLSPGVSRDIILSFERRAELIGAAHRLIKALIPHEAAIAALLANPTEEKRHVDGRTSHAA